MVYVVKDWSDGPDGGTPILAADLDHLEQGVAGATSTGEATASDVAAIAARVTALEQGLSQTNQNFDALFQATQDIDARVRALEAAAPPADSGGAA